MAACGEQDYSDWIPGSVASPGGSVPDEQQQYGDCSSREEATFTQAMFEEVINSRGAKCFCGKVSETIFETVDSRHEAYQAHPSSIDKAVKYHEMHDSSDTTSSAETNNWDVVQIKSVEDLSTLTAGKRDSQRWKYVCIALFCLLVLATATTVPLLLLLNRNNSPSSKVAPGASGSHQLLQLHQYFVFQKIACRFTMPSTNACRPILNKRRQVIASIASGDFSLRTRVIMCTCGAGNLQVVQACGCSSCEDELISYIDCQTKCLIDCQF
jgi:hypothetical protein